MKGQMIASATLASLALSATNAQYPAPAGGKEFCNCTATCSIVGDPHITDFAGETWLQEVAPGDSIQLYQHNNFFLNAVIGDNNWVVKLQYENTEYSVDDCASGVEFNHVSEMGDGTLVMNAKCTKKDNQWHFDTTIEKTDTGNAPDFATLEAAYGSTGLCVSGQSSRRRLRHRALSSSSAPQCTCSSSCTVLGDPHITTFADYEFLEKQTGMLALFSGEGFKISADVPEGTDRAISVDFGSTSYDAHTLCTSVGQQFIDNKTLSDKSILNLLLECDKVSGSNGYFWNTYITKSDPVANGSSATFSTLESGSTNTGICYDTASESR